MVMVIGDATSILYAVSLEEKGGSFFEHFHGLFRCFDNEVA